MSSLHSENRPASPVSLCTDCGQSAVISIMYTKRRALLKVYMQYHSLKGWFTVGILHIGKVGISQ